jgi:hypothetical protein
MHDLSVWQLCKALMCCDFERFHSIMLDDTDSRWAADRGNKSAPAHTVMQRNNDIRENGVAPKPGGAWNRQQHAYKLVRTVPTDNDKRRDAGRSGGHCDSHRTSSNCSTSDAASGGGGGASDSSSCCDSDASTGCSKKRYGSISPPLLEVPLPCRALDDGGAIYDITESDDDGECVDETLSDQSDEIDIVVIRDSPSEWGGEL